ncbi:MAG: hypothetical protein AAF074_13250, partial [Pseudomonadota bacterium]
RAEPSGETRDPEGRTPCPAAQAARERQQTREGTNREILPLGKDNGMHPQPRLAPMNPAADPARCMQHLG